MKYSSVQFGERQTSMSSVVFIFNHRGLSAENGKLCLSANEHPRRISNNMVYYCPSIIDKIKFDFFNPFFIWEK